MGEAGSTLAALVELPVAGGNHRMSRKAFFVFQAETIDAMRRAFEEVCGALQIRKGEPPSALAAERTNSPRKASVTRPFSHPE